MFATDELRLSYGDMGAVTFLPIGSHFFSAEFTQFLVSVNRGRYVLPEFRRAHFLEIGPYVLASTPGGREELRRVVDPELADLVDELQPKDLPAVWAAPDRVVHDRGSRRQLVRLRVFGSMTLTDTLRGSARCPNPRQECRTSPRRPRPRTWRISNGCGSSSVPIGAPPRF